MSIVRKEIFILKIGGSVITQKQNKHVFVRKTLLERIGKELYATLSCNPNTQLIIIHGAGSAGHQPAHAYNLQKGVGTNLQKKQGALITRAAIQKLNATVVDIFLKQKLPVTPVHTASVIVHTNKNISSFSHTAINEALLNDYIPVLYGDMVFDTQLNMSVCSGDTIAIHLATHYKATHILHATDVDGVYTADPHVNKNARLLEKIDSKTLSKNESVSLSRSHHTDVTGGLQNKFKSLCNTNTSHTLQEMSIFNGTKKGLFQSAIEKKRPGTTILF